MSSDEKPQQQQQLGGKVEKKARFGVRFEDPDCGDNWNNGPTEEGEEPRVSKTVSTILKSNIYRNKVRQQSFKAPKKSMNELLVEQRKIRTGPKFKEVNEDEQNILISGGDGSKPIVRNFSGFIDALKKNLEEKGYSEPTLVQKGVMGIISKKKGN